MTNYALLFVVAISNFLLGLFVFVRNPKKLSNIFFFLMVCMLSAWSIFSFFEDEVKTLEKAKFLVQLDFATALLMAFFFLLFCIFFIYPIKYSRIVLSISLVASSVFAVLSFSSAIIANVSKAEKGGLSYSLGDLFYLYTLIATVLVATAIIILFKKFIFSRGITKTQILYSIIGLSISSILALITNLILPRIIEPSPNITRFGIYGFLIFTSLTAYAIVKHRLMDIRMIVARSIVYTLLIALVGSFYAFSTIWIEKIIFGSSASISWNQIGFRIILALVVIFSFQPLKRWITKKTDKVFFKQTYDSDELLEELSHTMGSTIVLIELLYKILNILTHNMKVSRGFFVILKDSNTIDTTQGVGYKKSPRVSLKEIEDISKDGICIYDELPERSHIKAILRRYDAAIAIPLKSNNKLSGVLFLGEKSSGDMYSPKDLGVFEILGPEITVAVNNARSYEEIQQFNVVLREEIRKATKDLESANQNLRELDKAKDEFISMASHQLRTPLTAIKGYLSMLLEGDAGEIKKGQHEFVEEAYYGATRMVALINDLLNVSRMETGKFFLEIKEFDITKATEEELKQLDKAARDKGIKLVFKKAKHIMLCADEMKIRQVIMNFTDNAIYYTPEGKVALKLYEEGDNVCFEVTDNGIGVPKEQQQKLFTKFYRAENARSTRPDGTGLGLFMAKKVIEDHHGEIIFHSEEGRGSTFGFRLPKKAKITKNEDSASGLGTDISPDTKIDKAIEAMDNKIKKGAEKEKVGVN